ncbi:MAG: inositol monophosphatase [bacterium]|nr:inositol monophosphatase [bacterium]
MTDIDINWLLSITRKAGEIALEHFGNTKGTLKPDQSWVTQADLEIESYFRQELAAARPDDAILGEEGNDPAPDSPYVWAIDPIDGTRVFNHGLPIWGISIGLLYQGHPTLGAFLLPALGDLYHTDGQTAFYNGTPLTPPDPSIDPNALLLISEGAFQNATVDYPGKTLSLGSCAAHLCYVARGSAVGALDQAHIWDYAALSAILQVLGISLRYLSGEKLDYPALYDGRNVPEPTLACPATHFAPLQKAIVSLGP